MSVILVIDEHSVYRSGVRELIEARIQRTQVLEATRLEVLARSRYADLVLIDSGFLNHHLLDVLKEAHELNPTIRFAVMSASHTRADVLKCLSAGFHGFVYKLQSDEEFLGAIKDLLSGRIYVPEWMADGDGDRPEIPSSVNTQMQMPKLTPRQKEILPMIAQGLSTKEIAIQLGIAEGTTKSHTAALLRVLSARNRTEAAFMAAKLVGSTVRAETRVKHKNYG